MPFTSHNCTVYSVQSLKHCNWWAAAPRLRVLRLCQVMQLFTARHTAHYGAHCTLCCTLHTMLHTAHYAAHCTLCCTLHTMYYTIYTAHCLLCIEHFTLKTAHHVLNTLCCIPIIMYYTLYAAHCTIHTAQCIQYSANWTLSWTLHTEPCTLHTLHSKLNTSH